MSPEELDEAAEADESYPMTADDYARWLAGKHAKDARLLAESARAGIPMTGDVLATLLDNLAAIAEREAGRDS